MSEEQERVDIISTVDNFIEKVQKMRRIMIGVSVSAVVLAPFAIGLSIYLMSHPAFFAILEDKDEFGTFLGVMLGGIIGISGIWLGTGIRQYRLLSNWNERYSKYLKKREELDSQIATEYHLSEDKES